MISCNRTLGPRLEFLDDWDERIVAFPSGHLNCCIAIICFSVNVDSANCEERLYNLHVT